MMESIGNEAKKGLDTGFELVWKAFKTTRRGRRMLQVKYVAKYFFLAGIAFITKEPEDYRKLVEEKE